MEKANEVKPAAPSGASPFKFRQMIQVGAESFYLITESGNLLYMRADAYNREEAKVTAVKVAWRDVE